MQNSTVTSESLRGYIKKPEAPETISGLFLAAPFMPVKQLLSLKIIYFKKNSYSWYILQSFIIFGFVNVI